MRTAFIKTLEDLAAQDPRIMLVVGDLGYSVVEEFQKRFPRQFLNAGVAEQNMTGVAAGLALSGRIVFTYSIANFPVMRCFEQIRNDLCYHRLNVKIVAVGAGFHYGTLGSSHHCIEDLAVLRALPNIIIMTPGDPMEAAWATRSLAAHPGPGYLRIGSDAPVHVGAPPRFELGNALVMREGSGVTLVSVGGMLNVAVAAAEALDRQNIRARVLHYHTLKPFDREAIGRAMSDSQLIVTIEEHTILGGLGSAVAEIIAEENVHTVRLLRIGVPDAFPARSGSKEYLRKTFGLTSEAVVRRVVETMKA